MWGYSEKSSGGFQTVAALKGYGLLKEDGASELRKVSLSEDALRYFRDERPEEKLKLLQTFARKPKLIAAIWSDWGSAPPADPIARSHLKTDGGLNDQSARSLLAIYKENIGFAELKGEGKAVEISPEKEDDLEDGQEVKIGDLIQVGAGGAFQPPKPARVRAVQEHEGQSWVFIEGSEAGIPMEQVIIERKGATPLGAKIPPTLKIEATNPPHSETRRYLLLMRATLL